MIDLKCIIPCFLLIQLKTSIFKGHWIHRWTQWTVLPILEQDVVYSFGNISFLRSGGIIRVWMLLCLISYVLFSWPCKTSAESGIPFRITFHNWNWGSIHDYRGKWNDYKAAWHREQPLLCCNGVVCHCCNAPLLSLVQVRCCLTACWSGA